jgi:2-polyprenyl-3-methyl-5-hydroxy-6-metoxy-1,4-benzoquinol methylase
LATLADPSNRFWGIEGMPQAAAVARERYVEVLLGNLNEYRDFRIDRKFDVIVLADVLEHLLSPLDVLSWVNGLLAPGGRVILSLPNIANWLIRLRLLVGRFDYEETGILDRTHLHFYTYSSARRMVADAGLNVISCRAGASVLGPLIAALPLTKSLFATSIVIEARKEAAT